MKTALKFKVKIKDEFISLLDESLSQGRWVDNGLPGINKWLEYSQHNEIPWSKEYTKYIEHTGINVWNKHTGEWYVVCGLESVTREFDCFINEILINIVEKVDILECWYEKWWEPYTYILSYDGKKYS